MLKPIACSAVVKIGSVTVRASFTFLYEEKDGVAVGKGACVGAIV